MTVGAVIWESAKAGESRTWEKFMKVPNLVALAIGAAVLAATPVSIQVSSTAVPSVSFDRADARVGRPLTPLSVAGVQRRAYRRGYYGGGIAPGLGVGLGAAALVAAGAIAASNSGYGYGGYGYSGYGYPGRVMAPAYPYGGGSYVQPVCGYDSSCY
jgi:hypothetical protein